MPLAYHDDFCRSYSSAVSRSRCGSLARDFERERSLALVSMLPLAFAATIAGR